MINSDIFSFQPFHKAADSESVLYFAYGSNLNSKTHKWRQITSDQKSFPAILYDYKLVFDHTGFAFVEGAFANVKASPSDCIHGLAIPMTKAQFMSNIKLKESPLYDIEEVQIQSYNDKKTYNAVTLITKETDGNYHYPSRRYLDLVVEGAKEIQLQSDYVDYLEKFPDVRSSMTWFGKILSIFFIFMYIIPFVGFILIRKFSLKHSGTKILDYLFWPLKAIPLFLFQHLPFILKKDIKNPNHNRFMYDKKKKNE